MAILTISEQIKERISMHDVFEQYGYEPNRSGFVRCPFHSEKTPSLKAFAEGRRFKCFGCGASGSVIDFVMQLYGLTFWQAVVRINNDFGLGLLQSNQHVSLRDRRRESERLMQRKREERKRKEYINDLVTFRRLLWEVYLTQKPKNIEDPLKSGFIYALHNLDRIDAEIEELSELERR